MELSSDLISQFAKVTNDKKEKTERTSYGTIVEKDDRIYVRLDGSDILTPAYTTVAMRDGERVMVMIKNHTAVVTGNLSSPAAKNSDVEEIYSKKDESAKTATNYIREEEDLVVIGNIADEDTDDKDLRIDGKSIRFYIKSVFDTYKPYYESGDTVDVTWHGSGYVSGSKSNLYFSVPLAKPAIGGPSVSISSMRGLKVRQYGGYVYDSESYVEPNYYSASLSGDGGLVNIMASMDTDSTVYLEEVCAITASITIEFS